MSINDQTPSNKHPVTPPWIPKSKSSIKPPYIPPPKKMSQPKRYDCGMKEETHPNGWNQRWPWMHPSDAGPWVKYDDYAALAAENERLRKAAKLMDEVEAEWERIERKESGGCDIAYAIAEWKHFKEARDAK